MTYITRTRLTICLESFRINKTKKSHKQVQKLIALLENEQKLKRVKYTPYHIHKQTSVTLVNQHQKQK